MGVVEGWAARGRPLAVPGGPSTTVWEQGEGEPVVLVHGVPASSFAYRKVLPELAARGRRAVAFDLPGLGLAERPRGFDYTWSSLARWSLAAVDALGLRRFSLVVHDIGGPVGFELARLAGDRVRGLLALNTMVRVAGFRRPWVMEPFARRGVGELWLASMSGPAFALLMRRIGVRGPVPRAELAAYVELLKRGDGGRAFLRIMRSFERTEEFQRRILGHLARRPYPAAVAWGEDDPALPLATHGEQVRLALGLDALHRLPGRHFVQEDAPGQIAGLAAGL